jgi:hypothetical protein
MNSDQPISDLAEDRLGLGDVARHIATAIAQRDLGPGFVFAVEGPWGSGKSSLVNLVAQALAGFGDARPDVVRFEPWLIKDRDTLILELFGQLAQDKDEDLRKRLGTLAGALSGVARLARAASEAGVPLAGTAGDIAEVAGMVASSASQTPGIHELRHQIVTDFKSIRKRTVVIIDDLDRLDPAEVVEVLRLVKAVASLPNVTYLLAFDREVIESSVAHALNIDGGAYLEKIVQASFRMPEPDPYDLRRWFSAAAVKLLSIDTTTPDPDESRSSAVFTIWAGRCLKTPRDIHRTVNALRVNVLPVRDHIDVFDAIWLQLIRLKFPKLHDAVAKYVAATANFVLNRVHAHPQVPEPLVSAIESALSTCGVEFNQIGSFIPGRFPLPKYVGDLSHEDILGLTIGKRLGSPHHTRYYFALSPPPFGVSEGERDAFINLARTDRPKAEAEFIRLAGTRRPQGGTVADVLIDRLPEAAEKMPPEAASNILTILADHFDDNRGNAGWSEARRIFRTLLPLIPPKADRFAYVETLFRDGRALGFLTHIFRNETALTRPDADADDGDDRTLTPEEFEAVRAIMLHRYAALRPGDLLASRDLVQILFAWKQGGGADAVAAWIANQTEDDAGLVGLIERWELTDSRLSELGHFLDYDDACSRIKDVASAATDPELRARASRLLPKMTSGNVP